MINVFCIFDLLVVQRSRNSGAGNVRSVELSVEVGEQRVAHGEGQLGGLCDLRECAGVLVHRVLSVVVASERVKGPGRGPLGAQGYGGVLEETANVRAHLLNKKKKKKHVPQILIMNNNNEKMYF